MQPLGAGASLWEQETRARQMIERQLTESNQVTGTRRQRIQQLQSPEAQQLISQALIAGGFSARGPGVAGRARASPSPDVPTAGGAGASPAEEPPAAEDGVEGEQADWGST